MDAESYYLKGLVEYENNCYEAAIGYFEQSIKIEEPFFLPWVILLLVAEKQLQDTMNQVIRKVYIRGFGK